MQEQHNFDTLEDLARHIIEQGHVIDVPEPLFYDDEITVACDSCGARLTVIYSNRGQYNASGVLSADVEKRLLEKCTPLPTYLFQWNIEDEESEIENESDEDEELPV